MSASTDAMDEFEELMADDKAVPVTGIHLFRTGEHVVVSVEIGGTWIEVIRERHDGAFSHIIEPAGMYAAYYSAPPTPPVRSGE
jgi:hypothetical protein